MVEFSFFTKPWPKAKTEELISLTKQFGCDGIELPVRHGFPFEPANAQKKLPEIVASFAEHGLKVCRVAGEPSPTLFSACAKAGISFIRTMYLSEAKTPYPEAEASIRKSIERFLPLCEEYGIQVGIQQHFMSIASQSFILFQLVKDYPPAYLSAVWDAAHSGLASEDPRQALSIFREHLGLVNFKNAFYHRTTGPESSANYLPYFTTGTQGLCSWEHAVEFLVKKGYKNSICLHMEYSDEPNVEVYGKRDVSYLKELFTKYGREANVKP